MALRLSEVEPRDYIFICTPTGDELPPMVEHWHKLEQLLNAELIYLKNHTLDFWIREFTALPNWRQRWCTRLLKIQPTIAFLKANAPCTSYVGLRADEEKREGIYGDFATYRYPLREWGWRLAEVLGYLKDKKITIPERTDCARCYGQRLTEWKRLWRKYPDIYRSAEQQETETGATFRSPGRDTWPASLAELRVEFEKGRTVRGEIEDEDAETQACRVCKL